MANELHNAVALMRDNDMRDLVQAATVYQSRLVVTEADTIGSHANRLNMAKQVLAQPGLIADRVLNIIVCDPAVAGLGDTAAEIPESTIIAKVAEVWTPIANLYYTV